MKKTLSLILAIFLLMMSTAIADSATDVLQEKYAQAELMLVEGDYVGASEAFAELGSYANAPRYAMYCAAVSAGNNEQYLLAAANLNSLSGFMDSDLLAIYYTSRAYEAAEEYEEAAELLAKISLYKDSALRILTYPEKINIRDYAAADANEQSGALDAALRGFKKLGSYKDSAERAAAVQEKIYARDYDSALAYEASGEYRKAYDIYVALGSYRDCAERAVAMQNQAQYDKGMQAIEDYNYDEAYTIFAGLGDFKDSAEKAYCLGVSAFAYLNYISYTDKKLVSFTFHNSVGFVNLHENVTVAPQWSDVSLMANGLIKVEKDNYYGIVSPTGMVILPCEYRDVSDFNADGLCVVIRKDAEASFRYEHRLLNADGTFLGNWYAAIGDNGCSKGSQSRSSSVFGYKLKSSGQPIRVGTVVSDNLLFFGFVDMNGQLIIEPQYASALPFDDQGMAWVQDATTKKWGLIDAQNNVLIDFKYDEVLSFSAGPDGLADVNLNGIWQIIDRNENLVYFQ